MAFEGRPENQRRAWKKQGWKSKPVCLSRCRDKKLIGRRSNLLVQLQRRTLGRA